MGRIDRLNMVEPLVLGFFSVKKHKKMWVFPKIGIPIPQNGWFIVENPIKMDDFGVLFPTN